MQQFVAKETGGLMPTILELIQRREALASQGLPPNTSTRPAPEVITSRVQAARPQGGGFRGPRNADGTRDKVGPHG